MEYEKQACGVHQARYRIMMSWWDNGDDAAEQ